MEKVMPVTKKNISTPVPKGKMPKTDVPKVGTIKKPHGVVTFDGKIARY
jgi:hypothetical protein